MKLTLLSTHPPDLKLMGSGSCLQSQLFQTSGVAVFSSGGDNTLTERSGLVSTYKYLFYNTIYPLTRIQVRTNP